MSSPLSERYFDINQLKKHPPAPSIQSCSFDLDLCEETSSVGDTKPSLAKAETKTIRSLKLLIFLVLFLSAIGVSFSVYWYIQESENSDFEEQYEDHSNKVLAQLGASLEQTLAATDALVVSLVSHAQATNQTWPFVTVPNFDVRASKIRSLANVVFLNVYPLVQPEQRKEWEAYAATHNYWVNESLDVQANDESFTGPIIRDYEVYNVIHATDEYDKEFPGVNGTDSPGPYLPTWQTCPVIPRYPPYNWDLMSISQIESIEAVANTHKISISAAYMIAEPDDLELIKENEWYADFFRDFIDPAENPIEPVSDLYYPIIEDAAEVGRLFPKNGEEYNPNEHKYAGILSLSIYWREWLKNILPPGSDGIIAVFTNDCNPTFTYQINGPRANYLGTGDFHDPKYDYLAKSSPLVELRKFAVLTSTYSGVPINEVYCPFFVTVYPSDVMKNQYMSSNAIIFAIVAALIFIFTSLVFIVYDFWVERRQKLAMKEAAYSTALASSFFPFTVRDRVLNVEGEADTTHNSASRFFQLPRLSSMQNLSQINTAVAEATAKSPPPIADLFLDATVFFADLEGFTSWSAGRPPSQIFILLETLYNAFDLIAETNGVFKVETIGDCYVAATGLPKPQKQHAIIMSKFAADCKTRMNQLVRELDSTLGPGTSDLQLRIGIHSGPVTAGVLRGQKARFQLFGDTVNTASRMKSTGEGNRIQISEKTAELITAARKGHWLEKRDTLVNAKGKGELQTYWLKPRSGRKKKVSSRSDVMEVEGRPLSVEREISIGQLDQAEKAYRLVDWNVSVFEELLRAILANRSESMLDHIAMNSTNVQSDVSETILLPGIQTCSKGEVELSGEVLSQLRQYVTAIACSYRGNEFHNFIRASHVVMSANIIIQGMVSGAGPDLITFDSITKFAIVLAALVSDVDHPGISNNQLVKRGLPLASRYENKSVTEQNSFDVAWDLLMNSKFADLQKTIFSSTDELHQVRQVLVNAIMATDVSDEELNTERQVRWEKTFCVESACDDASAVRKANIAVELILQASSLFHTMQDWHSYQKWSKLLFQEMYRSGFQGGRDESCVDEWCKRELSHFDGVIVPLASQLRDMNIFGTDQLLLFAVENRQELEKQGHEMVEEWAHEEAPKIR